MIYKIKGKIKPVEYPLDLPPFPVKDFTEMKQKDAEQLLNWYIGEMPDKMVKLKNVVGLAGCGTAQTMDYTPNSLIPLWTWYLKHVNIIKKSDAEYEQEQSQYPRFLRYSVNRNKTELEWGQVAFDIGFYTCICFLEYDERLKWGIVPDPKLDGGNKPSILGFKSKKFFTPASIMRTLMSKSEKGNAESTELFDTFNVWVDLYL